MKGIFSITKTGFVKVSNISFDDVFTMINNTIEFLKSYDYNEKEDLIKVLNHIKFQHIKGGNVYEDNNTGREYIIPCDCIKMGCEYDLLSAFDKFTISNTPHQVGYLDIVAFAQILGAVGGHYHIREWGGTDLFFIP